MPSPIPAEARNHGGNRLPLVGFRRLSAAPQQRRNSRGIRIRALPRSFVLKRSNAGFWQEKRHRGAGREGEEGQRTEVWRG
jgi:hypothetical protein